MSALFFICKADSKWWQKADSVYEFSALDIDGKNVSLEEYHGHVLVIENVASF